MNQPMKDYLERAYDTERKHPEWRYGQALFNTLVTTHPAIAAKIRGTEIDPVFNTGVLPKFFQYVRENMEIKGD